MFILILFLTFFECCFAHAEELDKWLLPNGHPIYYQLKGLFNDAHMFESVTALEELGFTSEIEPHNARAGSILVVSHPSIEGYLIKKYPNNIAQDVQLA